MRSRLVPCFVFAVTLIGCGAHSETTCVNPDSADPACQLDARHDSASIFQGASAESDIPPCNAEREGRIYYVKATGGFKLCTAGNNIDIPIAGPQGPTGPAGSPGANGSLGEAAQSIAGLVPAGASLTLRHDLNTSTPLAAAYFVRKGLLRAVADYKAEVGRKSIVVSGDSWDQNIKPQVVALNDGNLAVIHENWPEQATRTVVVDIYSDEGEAIQLAAKAFPILNTIRAIAVANGLFIVYEPSGSSDELFTVIAEDGSTVVPPTVFGVSSGSNRIKDLKKLSDGNVVIAEQLGGNAASFQIINPVNATVVASNPNVAASSDSRTFAAAIDGRFMIYFTDTLSTPNARVAVFNNDGTLSVAPSSAGLGDETIMGSEAIARDRVAVVTSFFNNESSTLFDANLNVIRAKTIFSPLSADGSSPVSLGNGNWVVCSPRAEGYCITYDREGVELFRNGDLFASSSSTDFNAISAVGNEGRFAVATHDQSSQAGVVSLLQGAAGRLDLEVIDANSVRVVNRTVEALSIVLSVSK